MKLATYNVEWFSNLFDEDGRLYDDDRWSGRRDVTRAQQTAALGQVFRSMDADGIVVVEGPDSHARRDGASALEGFAVHFGLRTSRAIIGYINETQQEILFLYDPNVIEARHDPQAIGAPRFDEQLKLDLNTDARPETIRWSKPPLELDIKHKSGRRFRLIGVHAKSKAPHGARSDDEATRISIANRRKQLAQCIWLRRRVDAHLETGDDLCVMGDFNDGPGLDEYEKLFGRSGVEIVMGEGDATRLYDPHARQALSGRLAASPTTARFKLPPDGRYLSALLDYIMVSPGLRKFSPKWTILHPFDHPECYADPSLCAALLAASDHFPVTVDFAL